MSAIPVFEFGLWNAWIFMIPSLIVTLFFLSLAKKKKAPSPSKIELVKAKTIFCAFTKLIYFPAVALSFLIPLKLGTLWFYVGLPITLIGLVMFILVLVNWARTPPGGLVTKGVYRYSRHPMYVTTSLFLLGVSIASASWIFLLFPIIIAIGAVVFINLEEEECIKHYGDTYREYMKKTPRWLGLPKSVGYD